MGSALGNYWHHSNVSCEVLPVLWVEGYSSALSDSLRSQIAEFEQTPEVTVGSHLIRVM